MTAGLLEVPQSEAELEDRLSAPSTALIEDMKSLDGDIVVLGAGGKMGPSLCRLARRAMTAAGKADARLLAVSRWSNAALADGLRADGVDIVTADLTEDASLDDLPDAANVVYMVGSKFGTTGAEAQMWTVNTLLPSLVARRYAGTRMSAFSTGNVYPFVDTSTRGCTEADPVSPVGEYAMSCLGRERVLAGAAEQRGIALTLLRLNYAIDLRYGVIADVALAVANGDAVDVTMGHANVVWQGYANEIALRSMLRAQPGADVLNLTGAEVISIRDVAARCAELLDTEARTVGTEAPTALLNDASRCLSSYGRPGVDTDTLIRWQTEWIAAGLPLSGKPTGFQKRDGQF